MKVTGLYVEERNDSNTKEAVSFALKYFHDLKCETEEGQLSDNIFGTDIALLAVPYAGLHIASGYETVIDKLNKNQKVHWLLMLTKDDVSGKSERKIDDLALALKERGTLDILRFDNMTSERYVPLQTREMMEIMRVCDQIHKHYQ